MWSPAMITSATSSRIQDYWLAKGGVSFVAIGASLRKVHEGRFCKQLSDLVEALLESVEAGLRDDDSDCPMPKVQNYRFRDRR